MSSVSAFFLILVGLNVPLGCMQNTESTTRYFATFTGYAIPFHPAEEITQESIAERDTYYIAQYVGKRLVSFEKISAGQRLWRDTYVYWPESKYLQHRIMAKEDGTVIEQAFDRKGNLMKE